MNGTNLSALLFVIVGTVSSLYLLLEAALQSFGRSICPTEGCKVVSQYTRFGDLTMVLMGLAVVALVTFLAARGMRAVHAGRDRLINALLIISLAGEGFFVGYQLFRLNAVCIFCLSVFGIFVVLGVLRVLAGHREVLTGFGALLAVLSLFFLVLPAGGTPLPLDGKYILFYSPDCRHCAELRKELEEKKIEVRHVDIRPYAASLRNMGVEHVPTLLVNDPYDKRLLTGAEAVRRHLFPQPVRQPAKRPPASSPPTPGAAGRLELFPAASGPAFNPLPDAGLCKESVKCD